MWKMTNSLRPKIVAELLRELQGTGTVHSNYLRQCEALCTAMDEAARPDSALPFPKALATLYPDAAPESVMDAFRIWRSRLNQRLNTANATFWLSVSQNRRLPLEERLCWFEGKDLTTAKFGTFSSAEARLDVPIEPSRGRPRTVTYFVSYAHKDRQSVDSLLEKLHIRLALEQDFRFECWRDIDEILPGEKISDEIEDGIARSQIGLQMVSYAYMSSEFVRDRECPKCVPGREYSNDSSLLLGFPIAIDHPDFSNDGWEEFGPRHQRSVFLHGDKSYKQLRDEQARDAFADACVKQIVQTVRRYLGGSQDDPQPPSKRLTDEAMREAVSTGPAAEYVPARGHETRMQQIYVPAFDGAPPEPQGIFVLRYLLHWATLRRSTPLFALLGEYGMGKTVNCKQLTLELLERRKRARADTIAPPMPVYLDLRYARGLFRSEALQQGTRRFKHVEINDLVNAIFSNCWKAREKPDAADLHRLIARGNVVLIFDGFDEVAVHLHPDEAQSLIRTMWSLVPPDALSADAKQRPTGTAAVQMLISCRTHYFRDVAQQVNLFAGHQRDLDSGADLYDAITLLPFTEQQIERFLSTKLGDESKARRALDTIRSIHNLPELAQRPVLLDRIYGQLEQIEALAKTGERINAARLYDLLADEWLARDNAKHTLDAEIKKTLMGRLAGTMWRSGERFWPAGEIEAWLDRELRSDARLNERYAELYRGKAREILYEDLRTSAFVVRSDNKGFRFAHTSIQEYFLARYLFQTLRDGEAGAWEGIKPPPDCLDFLAEIACENAREVEKRRFFDGLGELLRDAYRLGVSEVAFWIVVEAQRRGERVAPRGSYRLEGAKLAGSNIVRRDGDYPVNLSGSDFTGANLRNMTFADVVARDCIFDDAVLDFACFEGTDLSGSSFQGVSALAGVFRHCRMSRIRDAGAFWRRTNFIHCRNLAGKDVKDDESSGRLVVPGDDFDRLYTLGSTPRLDVKLGSPQPMGACSFSPDGKYIVSQAFDDTLCLWDGETGQEIAMLPTTSETIFSGREPVCAFSPDGRVIAARIGYNGLRLWDRETCNEIAVLHTDSHLLCTWAFSPDGSRIAFGCSDGRLRLWNVGKSNEITVLPGCLGSLHLCVYSPDGGRILVEGNDNALRLVDSDTGELKVILRGHNDQIKTCAFSPDGARVVSGSSDGTLRLWNAETGAEISTLKGHTGSVVTCAFSGDGARIVSGDDDKTVRLWDGETGNDIASLVGHTAAVHTVAFSPDGDRIVSASYDAMPRLWDGRTGEEGAILRGHKGTVLACAISSDGKRIVSTEGPWNCTLRLWDGETGDELAILKGYNHRIASCSLGLDGRRIASSCGDHSLHLWDGRTGEETRILRGHTDTIYACAVSPDGSRAVSGAIDRTLRLWDCGVGREIAVLRGHPVAVLVCAFSPDGERIVSGAGDGTMCLWNGKTGENLAVLDGHRYEVVTCAFSSSGRRIVSRAGDGTLRLWDGETGEKISDFDAPDTTWTSACAFSLDGTRLVSGAKSGAWHLWDAQTGQEIAAFEGHADPVGEYAFNSRVQGMDLFANAVYACDFSPDGRLIVSGAGDTTVRVWDRETGDALTVFRGHTMAVLGCAFSPDGTRIVSGAQDHTLFLWNVKTGDTLAVLRGHTGSVRFCAFSLNGTRIVSAANDNTVRFWDAYTGEAISVLYHLPDGGHLSYSANEARVISASGNAWRYFSWSSPDQHPYPLLPLEADPRIGAIPKHGYRANADNPDRRQHT